MADIGRVLRQRTQLQDANPDIYIHRPRDLLAGGGESVQATIALHHNPRFLEDHHVLGDRILCPPDPPRELYDRQRLAFRKLPQDFPSRRVFKRKSHFPQ